MMRLTVEEKVNAWHKMVYEKDLSGLDQWLAEEIEFLSPVLWKPIPGKMAAFMILSTVLEVFEDFEYRREWMAERQWALEFSARVGDKQIKGVDLIQFNDEGKIDRFEVLVRPLNGLQALAAEMKSRLETLGQ